MTIHARFLPKYPKRIQVTDGLTKTEANGVVTLGFDYENSEFGAELQQAVDSTAADAISTAADRAAAEAAKDAAETAASNAQVTSFYYDTLAESLDPETPPDFINLAFANSSVIDGSGGMFEKVDSAPTGNIPSFQIMEGSYYQYRNRRVWKPEAFGAIGDGVTNDDAAFAKIASVIQDGDTIDLGGKTYLLDDDLVLSGKERISIVGKARINFASRSAAASTGKIGISLCDGFLLEGNFRLVGSEDATTWTALGSESARAEQHPLIYFDSCVDAKMQGLFRTEKTARVVVASNCKNFLLEGIRHQGWVPNLAPVLDGNIPDRNGVEDSQYLMTSLIYGSQSATVRNCRADNHGSVVVNGNSSRYVLCEDIVGRHMYDNVCYNSSGDEFIARNIRGDYCAGTICKSRGSVSTVTGVKGFSAVAGVVITGYPLENASRAYVSDVEFSLGHLAVIVNSVSDGGPTYTFQDATIRNVEALDLRATGSNPAVQVTSPGRVVIDNVNVNTFASGDAIHVYNGSTGSRGQFTSITNCTIKNGASGIGIDYAENYKIIGNNFQNLSSQSVVIVKEGWWGTITQNRSTDPTKRITLVTNDASCFYNSVIDNHMSGYGPTTGNEYWGNINVQYVPITGNVPFKTGQRGFDSATGKAMVSQGTSADTDWKLIY